MEEGSQQSCDGAGLGQVMSVPSVEPWSNFGCANHCYFSVMLDLCPLHSGTPGGCRDSGRSQHGRSLPILQLSSPTLLLLSVPSVKSQDERQPHQSQQQNSTCVEEIQLLPGATKWLSSFSLNVCRKESEQICNFWDLWIQTQHQGVLTQFQKPNTFKYSNFCLSQR